MTTNPDHEQEVENMGMNLSPNANRVYLLAGTQKFLLPKDELQEAEDIVKDLREELSEAQTQLEKATKNQPQPLAGESLDSDTAAPGCYSANDALKDQYYVPNPDFASLVMRSKEPELYRNGCTQRIRAFERNLLDENLSLSGLVDDAKNATFIRGDDEVKNNVLTDNASKKSEDEIRKVTESVLTPKLLSDTTEMSTRSGCSNVTDNDAGLFRPCSVQKAMDNDKMIIEESELTRPGIKRKKEKLSSPERLSLLDNDSLERKRGEEQNVSLEPQKSSLLSESSRES
ncbi:hypothetical protein ACE6H2_018082 [Prunus campanulata]